MITPKILHLTNVRADASREVVFCADHLVCFGWVGRDRVSLQAHIDELAQLGVPAPERVPISMHLSTYLLTTGDEIAVTDGRTSGEVEYVLLCRGSDIWVTVGSDQTARDIETKSLPASKQMCAKCLARECWSYDEVKDHWDDLILRCRVQKADESLLYQQSPLSSILDPGLLFEKLKVENDALEGGLVIFSGTIPTLSGVVYGDSYDLELEDPVMNRMIRHRYRVSILPQYL